MINEYWRSTLDKYGQKCYDTLLAGAKVRQDRIHCGWTKQTAASEAYFAIIEDHPELFYMANDYRSEYYRYKNPLAQLEDVTVDMIYIYSSPQIMKANKSIDGHISALKSKIAGMDDKQKVVATVEYVVGVTTYEIDNEYNQNAAAALHFGSAQCSGISKAEKLLLDTVDVKCCTVHGHANDNGKLVPHEWCIVTVNGKNYHIDPTFMLGCNTQKRLPYIKKWLFYDDDTLSKTHTWEKEKYPVCDDPSELIDDTHIAPLAPLGDVLRGLGERLGSLGNFGNFGNVQKSSINAPTFTNLRDFRAFMKKAMLASEENVLCKLDIKAESNDVFTRYVKSAVDMVQNEVDVSTGVSMQIRYDGVLSFKIQYGDNIGKQT